MRYSTVSGLMMAALIGDAVAGPTHAHMHRHAHQKKDVDWSKLDWENMNVDWTSAWAAGQKTAAPAPVATSTPAAVKPAAAVATQAAAPVVAAAKAPAQASSSSSSPADSVSDSSSISDLVSNLFGGVVGISNSRSSFGSQTAASGALGDNYQGNVGSPYGSNVIKAKSTSGYDFTNTFINTSGQTMTINIWQKVGPDHRDLSGSAMAPHTTTLTFVLKAGASQVVAIQENSQIGWAQSCSETAQSGAFQTAWGEANFVATGSGYDVSYIMNNGKNDYDMTISSKEVSCVSSMTENYWLTATQPIGNSDGSCYVPMSTMHLTTKMGGKA